MSSSVSIIGDAAGLGFAYASRLLSQSALEATDPDLSVQFGNLALQALTQTGITDAGGRDPNA